MNYDQTLSESSTLLRALCRLRNRDTERTAVGALISPVMILLQQQHGVIFSVLFSLECLQATLCQEDERFIGSIIRSLQQAERLVPRQISSTIMDSIDEFHILEALRECDFPDHLNGIASLPTIGLLVRNE